MALPIPHRARTASVQTGGKPMAGTMMLPTAATVAAPLSPQLPPPGLRTASVISGWTAAHLVPHVQSHAVTQSVLNQNPPQQAALQTLTNHVLGLNDPTLGSRNGVVSTQPPTGQPVGSASVYQNSGVPATVQSAMNSLQTNTQTNDLASLINRILGNSSSGGSGTTPSVSPVDTAKLNIMNAPASYQQQLNNIAPSTAIPTGISSAVPSPLGNQSQIAASNQYQDVYAAQRNAQQGAMATGWTPYMPTV